MAAVYPLLLDVSDQLIVIIGGGAVALRKARGLREAGAARVRCVSPSFHAEMPENIERVEEEYDPRHLDGADLVFAATDRPEVNDAVVRDCRVRRIWVNRADADESRPGDFVTPAKLEQGAVLITVAAGSAALSAALRDHLAQVIDPRYVHMADAMRSLRPLIRGAPSMDASRRAAAFRALAGEEAMAVLDQNGIEGLREWIGRQFPEVSHG